MSLETVKNWNRISKWMMALSLVFIVMGGIFGVRTYQFLERAVKTDGTIVELVERRSDEGDILYAPVFTYTDAGGNTHKIFSSTASYPPIGDVGDKIVILYDPEDPGRAKENRFFSLWGLATVMSGVGIFDFIVFFVIAFFTKKKMMAEN